MEDFLDEIINEIVSERRGEGESLTWRVMHEIEEEALRQIEASGHASQQWIRMVRNSKAFCRYPQTDAPVSFGGSNVQSITAGMVEKAYKKVDD